MKGWQRKALTGESLLPFVVSRCSSSLAVFVVAVIPEGFYRESILSLSL
jgi:hypothetical protein